MDIYTKAFFINFVVILFFAGLDSIANGDNFNFGRLPYIGWVFNLWALVTLISIPIWLVYLIITYL